MIKHGNMETKKKGQTENKKSEDQKLCVGDSVPQFSARVENAERKQLRILRLRPMDGKRRENMGMKTQGDWDALFELLLSRNVTNS